MRALKIVALAFAALLISCSAAMAESITLVAQTWSGDPATAILSWTGEGTNTITFTIETVPPPDGDLRAVFIDLNEAFDLPTTLSVIGDDVTNYAYSLNNVLSIDGVGMEGATSDPFDVGVILGTPGEGKDDISRSVFQLISEEEPIFLGDRFGARITSVGIEDDREGSSKLLGFRTPGISTVPEPSTMLLFSGALGGLAFFRRYRLAARKA